MFFSNDMYNTIMQYILKHAYSQVTHLNYEIVKWFIKGNGINSFLVYLACIFALLTVQTNNWEYIVHVIIVSVI